MSSRRGLLGAVVLALRVGGVTSAAFAHPSQHGLTEGHLIGSGAFGNIELVGKLDLPGEGMQVVPLETKWFEGNVLVMNNEQCGKNGKGGVSLWDVTNPRKPYKLSEHFGDRGFADTNDIHSAFAWQAGDKAYLVMTDNFETTDVDVLDMTNPKRPRLVADLDLNALARTQLGRRIDQVSIGLGDSSLHDMIVKQIGDRFIMLLSYWDGGYLALDVADPANPRLLDDTDFTNPDPQLLESAGIVLPPEGNGHQAEFTADNRFFVGTESPALGLHKPGHKFGQQWKSHLLAESANAPGAINSDIAFWGDKAFVGKYDGFRIFDISGATPTLIKDFRCYGPQNDLTVWDRNGDGQADLLFASAAICSCTRGTRAAST